ncbi:MAG: DUF433 domain-containing protein [Opitutales bacterium]|jgi:uncharacterized protein (DUF433 family)
MSDDELLAHIEVDARKMAGKPVIRGTRMTVEHVLNQLAHGQTVAGIAQEYPGLTEDAVRACVLYAQRTLADTTYAPLTR